MTELLQNCCRACRSNESPFVSLLDENLYAVFHEFTGLPILYGDPLPLWLCVRCKDDLYAFKSFKNLCISTDTYLRYYLSYYQPSVPSECPPLPVQTTAPLAPVQTIQPQSYMPQPYAMETSMLSYQTQPQPAPVAPSYQDRVPSYQSSFMPAPQAPQAPVQIISGPQDCTSMNQSAFFMPEPPPEPEATPLPSPTPPPPPPPKFTCNECPFEASTLDELEIHLVDQHFPAKRRYSCKHCRKPFETRKALDTHRELLGHKKRRPKVKSDLPCQVCGKLMPASRLPDHLRRNHSNARPFTCPRPPCTAAFKAKAELTEHLASVHDRRAEFSCHLCGAGTRFVSKKKILAHMLFVHKAPHAAPCPYCDKRFATPSKVRKHIRAVHLDERAHACPICYQRFQTNAKMETHIYSHSATDAFSCPVAYCGGGYSKAEYLRLHMRRDHGIESCGKLMPNPIDIEELKRNYFGGVKTKKPGKRAIQLSPLIRRASGQQAPAAVF